MTRYFLTAVKIEGFRGIRNEGKPLEIKFDPGAVNSIYAANGLGKSSVFEAIAYAITGNVPKLERMVSAESAKDYYCNHFHTKRRAEITLTFAADDGSDDVVITVEREASGKQTVISPSGYAKPEMLLATLAEEAILLDHQTFVKFLLDSPLERGKTFSSLLGLSKLAEMRQGLLTVANTMAFNSDSNLKVLESQVAFACGELLQAKQALRQDYFSLTGLAVPDPIDLVRTAANAVQALASVALLKPLCENMTLDKLDFLKISSTIKTQEKSEEQERLKTIISNIAAMEALAPSAGEAAEMQNLMQLCAAKDAAFAATKGASFHDLYAAVRKVYDDGSWTNPTVCPACESSPASPPYEIVVKQLKQYEAADEAVVKFGAAWTAATYASRLQKLEAKLIAPANASENLYNKVNSALRTGQGTERDLRAVSERISKLDEARAEQLTRANAEKALIEGSLPPSLVALIEQVERAKRIKATLMQMGALTQSIVSTNRKIAERKRWKAFIDDACDTFEQAEARLSGKLTSAMATQYKEMYATIASGKHIVPSVEQKKNSIDLNLRLENFFGLKNMSAMPLLSESYRNAVAISIFLSASLQRKPTARFIVLDDVTSSFDAGHQYALMEVLRTQVGLPLNKDGLQVILLSHDGLLEKYFDKLGNTVGWNHQHLQGLPPDGNLMTQAQGAERLRTTAESFLHAGQGKQAEPLIRQHLEYRMLQIISKVGIPVPLDFAIRGDRKMVSNALEAIQLAVEITAEAKRLVMTPQQQTDISMVHVPALMANWVSHYETASASSFDPRVLLGILSTCDGFAECFRYDCSCLQPGKTVRRYYKSLSAKHCRC
jgi:DNA repair exonuclease SbcCD ATPase subunit